MFAGRTASEAKAISEEYITDKVYIEIWKTYNIEIILMAKAESYEPFTEKKLFESNATLQVEATMDTFWGAGTSEVPQQRSL